MSPILCEIDARRRHLDMSRIVAVALLLAVFPQRSVLGAEPTNARPHFASTPATIAEWKQLETQVEKQSKSASRNCCRRCFESHQGVVGHVPPL